MKLKICTCPECATQTTNLPSGQTIPGRWVHPSTCAKHWLHHYSSLDHLNDLDSALPAVSPRPRRSQKNNLPTTSPESSDTSDSTSDSESPDRKTQPESIKMIYYFIGWLGLMCGLSQSNCRIARDWIVFIIKTFRTLPQDLNAYQRSYKDVRTITKRLGLDPQLESCTCCPKCFSLYEPEDAPEICTYRKSKKAQVCGESLFKSNIDPLVPHFQPTSRAVKRRDVPFKPFIPRLVYHTQTFDSWLNWFLNVPGIEDKINSWRQKVQSVNDDKIVDIQQSKAWKSFTIRTDRKLHSTELRLTFSLYIDWFNPFTNKLAGRQASLGVVALTCMDLSPHSRNKRENIFIAGMIPAPKEPDMTTISHVLAPLVDELLLLNTGTFVKTPQFPDGRRLSVHLGALIGDIVATHKIAGFASHSAKFFCSWCKCQKPNIENMQFGPRRKRRETRLQASQWKSATTLAEKTRLLKRYGTRWSELNRLPYWDPVKNVTLSIMHNWYEGVLQHHWRVRWAFEPDPPKHTTHDDQLDDWEADSEKSDASFNFQDTALTHIRKAIINIIVPRGVTQVPPNLGDPKHGKLKASEWHSLFATYLPLSLIDYFFENSAWCTTGAQENMLLNFSSLVLCTNIVSLKSVCDADCNKLSEAYGLYTETSKLVFDSPKIVPNHHYALHLSDQLKWWGPLSNVSEFSGERINGILQQIKTNSIIGSKTPVSNFGLAAARQGYQLQTKTKKTRPSPFNHILAMLQKLQYEDATLRHYTDVPHPEDSHILSRYVIEEEALETSTGIYVSKSKPNRLVAYHKEGQTRYGWVTHVYRLPEYEGRLLVVVKLLADVSLENRMEVCDNFRHALNDLELKVVREENSYEMLDPGELRAVCAYRLLPAWTFSHHQPLVVLRQMPHELSPLLSSSSAD
ncbi:hypothetical protein PSHT_03565 [Puccinia striiformis]|uniref:Uncharacterized protein n=1 Tax=Puccinia striiformis TaxID=27350 RepID=A0A2S4WF86_9BASI|nr:hypothetical protein PSHT_03565 [Puccinia striiformis]